MSENDEGVQRNAKVERLENVRDRAWTVEEAREAAELRAQGVEM